ncbi:MAG: hypothetical protein LBI73_00140 [Myroides sp.]|jgi:hypothetical protein|nr:hypothetical protein [Myroides sp.]
MKTLYQITLALLSTYLLGTQIGYAQPKIYTVSINPITESGYYNIELDTRLIGAANSGFSNLRILQKDSTGVAEVPYFIRNAQPTAKETKIIDYKVSNSIEQDSINRFIVHNEESKKVSDFYITINKADVSINAAVRGSNDNKSWFIVKQKKPIYKYTSTDKNEITLFVSIPEGQYKYYEIELVNNQSSPLKINKVTTAIDTKIYGQFQPTLLELANTKNNKKDKTSIVSFTKQKLQYKLSKLAIEIDTPKDYYRKAILKDSISKVAIPFILSSKNSNEFIIDDILVHNPYIEIYNGDNTPLTIKSVKTYSLTRYATAYLNADVNYTIRVDNITKDMPDYDIQHFKNDIPSTLPIVQTQDFYFDHLQKTDPEKVKKMDNTLNNLLWAVIIVVGLVIALICYKTFRKLAK